MATLVEFIHPLRKASRKNCILAVIYFLKHSENYSKVTVDLIRSALTKGAIPGAKSINISGTLANSAPYVESLEKVRGKTIWGITRSGEKHVKKFMGLSQLETETANEAGTLEDIAQSVSNADTRQYIEEALKCLRAGALRASIVFIWAGAISEIQQKLIHQVLIDLNTAIQKYDKNARVIKRLDHFEFVKESTQLLAARELGIIDKGQHTTLEDALNLRNRCGHPGRYSPGIKKVSSVIEDLVGIIF